MPEEIISNRDKLFILKFWQFLMKQLGTNYKLLTAFYLQTDRQIERLNQILEQYLYCYVNYRQNNWVELLLLVQFAYNSVTMETTNVLPFYANYSREPQAYWEHRAEGTAQRVMLKIEQLRELQWQLA